MILQLRFFARIREAVGCDTLRLELPGDREWSIEAVAALLAERGPQWSAELMRPNTLSALNQAVCDRDQTVSDGDELAFFPPVTGG